LVNSHQSGLHSTPNKGVECAGERDAEPRAEKNSHDTALMMMKKFLGDEFSATESQLIKFVREISKTLVSLAQNTCDEKRTQLPYK
jgi:hypothetical protein